MLESSVAKGTLADGSPWHIHYTVQGSGPDVVMLHGGGPGATGSSNYSKNVAALAQHFRCWVIDFPGWGQSSKNLNAWGGEGPFQNGGRAVLAFMAAVGIAHAHLIGNSFGGSAALCAALAHPQRVDKLVLMGPGGGVVPGAKGPTEGIVQLLTYYLGEGPTLAKLEAFIQNLVYDTSVITPALLQERFNASNVAEIIANPPLLPPPPGTPPSPAMFISQEPRLADLPHPALFIWGLQDKVNPVEGMQGFRNMPNADFLLLSKCGHWAQWEHADKFNDLVLGFLRRA